MVKIIQFSHFYSDPHFGHANIIKYADRPFTTAAEMDRELIRRYNEVIKPKDTVLWLGDCTFRWGEAFHSIMRKLRGKKLLIRGNHDKGKPTMLTYGFEEVMDGPILWGDKYVLSHYPPRIDIGVPPEKIKYYNRRPVLEEGQIIIHGHTHEKERFIGNQRIHVGVDAWDYYPVPVSAIIP